MRAEHSCYTICAIKMEASFNQRMTDRKAKWLMYTVTLGLLPALLRLMIGLTSPDEDIDLFSAVDFILFGLVLHISNINELEHFTYGEKSWKTIQNGASLAFLALYCGLYVSHLHGETGTILLIVSMLMGISSFLISFTVYNRTSADER